MRNNAVYTGYAIYAIYVGYAIICKGKVGYYGRGLVIGIVVDSGSGYHSGTVSSHSHFSVARRPAVGLVRVVRAGIVVISITASGLAGVRNIGRSPSVTNEQPPLL